MSIFNRSAPSLSLRFCFNESCGAPWTALKTTSFSTNNIAVADAVVVILGTTTSSIILLVHYNHLHIRNKTHICRVTALFVAFSHWKTTRGACKLKRRVLNIRVVVVAARNSTGFYWNPLPPPSQLLVAINMDDLPPPSSSYAPYDSESDDELDKPVSSSFDDYALMWHRRRMAIIWHHLNYNFNVDCDTDPYDEEVIAKGPPKKRRKKGIVWYRSEEGDLKILPPTMSLWYNLYCFDEEQCVETQPNFHAKFRNRFRMPYRQYKELLQLCRDHSSQEKGGYFRRWKPGSVGGNGDPAAPLDLLLLAALRYIGRGWTFDDLEEATAISREVIRSFFHKFIEFGKEVLYPKWVTSPATLDDAAQASHEFSMAGFPGCIGSMDATHVETDRIPFKLRQAHLSFKLPFTARTYNLVCNHRKRILSTTHGHPARWNDKTLVAFDGIATDLHFGRNCLEDLPFQLYAYDNAGEIVTVKYKGAWLLVDNGYLNWGVTIPPKKDNPTVWDWRFSKWLESMRKDVECCFGILKGRWRVLKAGVRLHGTDAADKIWLTCCALHNWLLVVDGLDEQWRSDWDGSMGQLNAADMPDAVRRLFRRQAVTPTNYDSSAIGYGPDRIINDDPTPEFISRTELTEDGSIKVRKLSMNAFRERLITHFKIAFQKKELSWPKARLGGMMEPQVEDDNV